MLLKKIYSLIIAVICIFAIAAFSACGKDEADTPDSPYPEGIEMTNDRLGFDRPKQSWLTDLIIIPTLPADGDDLFGTGGKSGLLSEWALEKDGTISKDNTGYIVYLMQGNPNGTFLKEKVKTYIDISLVSEKYILSNENCITLGEPEFLVPYSICPVTVDISIADKEARFSEITGLGRANNCALCIPFTLKEEGILTVDMIVQGDEKADLSYEYLDVPATADSLADERKNSLKVEKFDVNIYSEEKYNNGDFSAITDGSSLMYEDCYAVIDFSIISTEENDGNRKVNFLTKMPGRGFVDVTIESANTSDIEEIDSLDGTTIYTSFSAPSEKNESKSIRVVLKLKGITGGSVPISFSLSSDNATGLTKNQIITRTFSCGTENIIYTLNDDKRSYTLTSVTDNIDSNVVIPDRLPDGCPVTAIARGVFYQNKRISRIELPESVEFIGDYAFAESNVSTIIIKGAPVIGAHAFEKSYASDISFGGTRVIGENAFAYCWSLKTLVLPSGIEEIQKGAFYYCPNLSDVYYNASASANGVFAKDYDTQSTPVTINIHIKDLKNWCEYPLNLDSKTKIFLNEALLEDVNVPEGTLYIASNAFKNYTYLKSINIPNSTEEVGSEAFLGCKALEHVTIGKGLNKIGRNAFSRCEKLLSVTVDENNAYFLSQNRALYSKDLTTLIRYFSGNHDITFVIPESVYVIEDTAFDYSLDLVSVTVSKNVSSVGKNAFFGCENIYELVNLSALDSSNLGNIILYRTTTKTDKSDIIEYGDFLFYTYKGIHYLIDYTGDSTDIVLPEDYFGEKYNIYKTAFKHIENLTSIKFSGGINEVGEDAFSNFSKIEKVIVDDIDHWFDITFINQSSNPLYRSNNLYENDEPVTVVVIPEHVTEVKDYQFVGCHELESLVIGPHVTKINLNSFRYCHNLRYVYCFADNYEDFLNKFNITEDPRDDLSVIDLYFGYWAGLLYYREEPPQDSGWYWYYDENGNIVKW